MTEPVGNEKEIPKRSPKDWLVIFGFWFVTIILFTTMLSKCSEEPGVTSAQREKYDRCMLEKQRQFGLSWVKADGLCAYWKRADP
jgi:hypothetical protein